MSEISEQKLILASRSPRRSELLKNVGVKFEIEVSDIPEISLPGEKPRDLVERLSLAKAGAVAELNPQAFVLGADTTVAFSFACYDAAPDADKDSEWRIFGKPSSRNEAVEMLMTLQGKTHTVYTGFSLVNRVQGIREVGCVATEVTFTPLTKEEIEAYVDTGEPMDKAGAYGAQGRGLFFVASYRGSYTNVVGLPVPEVLVLLRRYGLWKAENLMRI